ncbi:MAG: hypothetical protein ABXS92_05020 [Sulfurimonas sp.]
MIKTAISAIILFSVVIALVFHYFSGGLAEGLCSNKPYQEYLSPNQTYKAVVFQRACGPSSGSTTQISIIDASENLKNRAGNVLVIKGYPKRIAPKLEWNGEQEVIIHHPLDGSEFRAETRLESDRLINITYSGRSQKTF